MAAKSRSSEPSGFSVARVAAGMLILLLTLLDYLQDGNAERGIITVASLMIVSGVLLYLARRKRKS